MASGLVRVQNVPVAAGRQFAPPVLVPQVWKLPVAERSFPAVVVGLNVPVPVTEVFDPAERAPTVIVSTVLRSTSRWRQSGCWRRR